jgi:3-oxoacyl-[acyl-carrier protein] reductase
MNTARFREQTVLITGGTRGIGRACAERFAAEGARVLICGRGLESVEKAAAEIGGDTRGYACDVSDAAAAEAMMASLKTGMGGVDVLVNNAGITRDGLILRMKDEDWSDVLAVSLNGAFHLSRAAAKLMIRKRAGRIINISSITGLRGQAGQANYAAAKAGLIGFTKALARELAPRGITVNAVAPGYIESAMTAGMDEKMTAAVLARIPLGRAGLPADAAAAVAFLASPDAAYITGAVLRVDGGLGM